MWRGERDAYLACILWLEGRGDSIHSSCRNCGEEVPTKFRCRDCFGGDLWCEQCTVSLHVLNPLHRIQASKALDVLGFLSH